MLSPVHPASPSVSLARGREAAACDALASTDALWVRSGAPARRRGPLMRGKACCEMSCGPIAARGAVVPGHAAPMVFSQRARVRGH
uniref:Uncharacterized protein n=1 Tax=Setaria italica TaxID=4555 RepID=K3YKI9_SETIT